jgi:hypothetical protein
VNPKNKNGTSTNYCLQKSTGNQKDDTQFMNNKTEIALGNHIARLEKDIAEAQARIKQWHLSNDGMEAVSSRDDAKKIALLREGVVPKYSDLPASNGFENNLPEIEMMEFADLTNENANQLG